MKDFQQWHLDLHGKLLEITFPENKTNNPSLKTPNFEAMILQANKESNPPKRQDRNELD